MKPESFYRDQLKYHLENSKNLKRRLILLSSLRLLAFVLTTFGIYLTRNKWQIAAVIGIVGASIFLWLLSKYTDLKSENTLEKALIAINEEEIRMSTGSFHHRAEGKQFLDPKHYYSFDIDLFGRGSLFQYLNRTTIKEGTLTLVNVLTENNITNIEDRQEAIKDLADKPKWRQHYEAIASLVKVETPTKYIINWLADYKPFLSKVFKWLPVVFSIASISVIALSLTQIIHVSWLGYWLIFGLGITGIYLKKINILAFNCDKVKDTFRQYALLLDQIENENFQSELLKTKQQKIKSESKKASLIFKELSKGLDALDNRNNLISAVLGNGFFLWDIMQSYRIEQWINRYSKKVEDWFEVVSFFDAFNSLANYGFNHPDYVYPKIMSNKTTLDAIKLGHPLLDPTKRVSSDLTIKNQEFFIVTGANMAGKSTFLRTVSLHIVMANVGLPVCAEQSNYSPVKLITSMRTSDSLTDDSSYFFSELTRLKFIVDQIDKEPYFIILDEILKGTNSTDKAIGSRKFVEKLVAGSATGIIATHDLSLCEISEELEDVKNYYFDAEIVNDELYFDYKFKKGICQNMNASFLLKKMEIV